jgi:nucleoside-diphosphate-sugar epimerase
VAVVVTGGAGFVGSALVRRLRHLGEPVVTVDRRPARTPSEDGVVELVADLLERDELVTAALQTATSVVHLAGCPGVRDASPDVDLRRARDNVDATTRVLAAVPPHVPVVVASSSSVYGGSDGRPSREGDRLAPRGGYARSKVEVERLCGLRRAAGGRVTVVRPFTVLGEGQRPDMAVSRWIGAAREDRPLVVLGSPERTRDVTDVRSVARVLADLADPQRPDVGTLNVGCGVPRTLAEIVAAVATAVGHPVRTVVTPATAVEPRDTWADPTRLRAVLGYRPRTDLTGVVARAASSQPLLAVGA